MRARQRPDAAVCTLDRLKLHRHRVRLDGREYTVLTLRPGTYARFNAASPDTLRTHAVRVATLGEYHHHGMDYTAIDRPNGEVQVFRDYRRRVSAARVARREVLGQRADRPHRDDLNPLIWQRGSEVRRRVRP